MQGPLTMPVPWTAFEDILKIPDNNLLSLFITVIMSFNSNSILVDWIFATKFKDL